MARVFCHTNEIVVLGAEVSPEMTRNRSKAVRKGNGPVAHHDEFECDEPMLVESYRLIKKLFDRSDKQFDELTEKMRAPRQRFSRTAPWSSAITLAMEADVTTDKKTSKHTEDAAADRVKNEDKRFCEDR